MPSALHEALGFAALYRLSQRLIGAVRFRRVLVSEYVRPVAGERILDVGCGPADVLAHLGAVDYVGFDPNPRYVEAARRRYGDRGRFTTEFVDRGEFDAVLLVGVLHHLSDELARTTLGTAARLLAPGGRLISVDPCRIEPERPVARFLIRRDRGAWVRTEAAYRALVAPWFECARAEIRRDLLTVPFTHFLMDARPRR